MTADTTAPSYWLNWRFLLCAIWIFVAMVITGLVIWRYEGLKNRSDRDQAGQPCNDDSWTTCSESVHPVWLLVYRVVAFCVLLSLILADTIVHTFGIFQFYTQWTFTLVTIYFGMGSILSIHGCLHSCCKLDSEKDQCVRYIDAERGPYEASALRENANTGVENDPIRHIASVWECTIQIIFQICAGAVVLTDSVFWLVIYPFLTDKDYRLAFLVVCMHSVNAVFLIGDTILNSLRFPFFRIAYFVLWTSIYVVFQWIVHACVSMSWPYPFLDISSQYSPIWYLAVGLLHFPCYGIFTLIFKIKRRCLAR